MDKVQATLVTQTVNNLPAVVETQGQSLCQEDALEKGMGTYSSILSWRCPWTDIGKDSDAGRDWGQEKGTTEDEMAG